MPTNAIGTGTVNVNYNAPVDERALLDMFRHGSEAMGATLRRLVLKGAEVENAELAAQLKEVRRRYYGVVMLFVGVCSIGFGKAEFTSPAAVEAPAPSAYIRKEKK